jgi:hypothetical protein
VAIRAASRPQSQAAALKLRALLSTVVTNQTLIRINKRTNAINAKYFLLHFSNNDAMIAELKNLSYLLDF